jgi:hypothetical protein
MPGELDIYEYVDGIVIKEHRKYMKVGLTDSEQRELLVWFKKNRPMMCGEIFCDNCTMVER